MQWQDYVNTELGTARISEGFGRDVTTAAKTIETKEKFGGRDRDRTGDPLLAKQVLSQLSYTPTARTLNFKAFTTIRKVKKPPCRKHHRLQGLALALAATPQLSDLTRNNTQRLARDGDSTPNHPTTYFFSH